MANGLTFKLFGHDVSASKTIEDVGKTAAGVGAGLAGAAVLGKIKDFAAESMNAFANVGQVLKLQRFTGGTAEAMSHLAADARGTGTDMDSLTKGIQKLSIHVAANDKVAKSMGIAFRDSHGHIKPMDQIVAMLSDKFSKMPNGVAKTAQIVALFGKSGMDLLPMLNKGSEGLAKMNEESDKLGTTLSQKDLDALKANTIAKRKFHEAIEGIQIAIGKQLYPVVTAITIWFQTKLLPAIMNLSKFLGDHKEMVMKVVVAIAAIITAMKAWNIYQKISSELTKAWTVTQKIFNEVMKDNPLGKIVLVLTLVAAGLVLLYQKNATFRAFVLDAWARIQVAVKAFVNWFITTAVPWLQMAWNKIVLAAQAAAKWFTTYLMPTIIRVFQGIFAAVSAVVTWFITSVWPHLITAFNIAVVVVGVMAKGIAFWIGAVITVLGALITKGVAVFAFLKDHVFDPIVGAAQTFFSMISGPINAVRNLIGGMFDGVLAGAKAAFNGLASLWNNTLGSFSVTLPAFGPFGGGTISLPKIPMLVAGGIAMHPTLAMIGEAGPEAIVPLHGRSGLGGGDIHIHIAGTVISEQDLARTVRDSLSVLMQRKGRNPAAVFG